MLSKEGYVKCVTCEAEFIESAKGKELRTKLAPEISDAKFDLPTPITCPECREQRRMAFRNERRLYQGECNICNKTMLSVFSVDKKLNSLCNDCFWSDKLDGTGFAVEYDPNEQFFIQFKELFQKAKLLGLFAQNIENSDYVNQEMDDKNCYMCVGGHYNQDCYYSTYSLYGDSNVDSYFVWKSNNLYESINCQDCSNSKYLNCCDNCSNCYLCENCIGCNDCFGSCNLRRKQYVFFNKHLSKEEYEEKLGEYLKDSKSKKRSKDEFAKHRLNFPKKFAGNRNVENCTGDNLANCKEMHSCFWSEDSENSNNAYISGRIKDTLDTSSLGFAELCYETASSAQVNRAYFSSHCTTSSDIIYSYACFNSKNLFGCIGLNRKEFCILNKQYSKEEYFEVVKQIVAKMEKDNEWGKFFPLSISPFGYNETVAQERYPLDKEKAKKLGAAWKNEDEKRVYSGPSITPSEISQCNPSINRNAQSEINKCLNSVIICEITGKPFKVAPQELRYYIKHNIEIPTRHPDQRHLDRLAKTNPMKLYHRKCMNDTCTNEFETTYAPDRPEKVYCETCYQKEAI